MLYMFTLEMQFYTLMPQSPSPKPYVLSKTSINPHDKRSPQLNLA